MKYAAKVGAKAAAVASVAVGAAVVLFLIFHRMRPHPLPPPSDPASILAEANRLSWLGNWDAAGPLYARAEDLFRAGGDRRSEIYARVGRTRAQAETISLANAVQVVVGGLRSPIAKAYPKLRL